MKRDQVFQAEQARTGDFEFDGQVVEVFDDMLSRSIPFYEEQQRMVTELSAALWRPGTSICDLGCSTANTLIRLCERIDTTEPFFEYDSSFPMLERARRKVEQRGLAGRVKFCHADFNSDLADVTLPSPSVVTLCWSLQFVRPIRREALIRWIAERMERGGALIVAEKVLTNHPDLNRVFVDGYYAFKRRNGYSDEEIIRKRRALENVLIPYRLAENHELFRRNGFSIVEQFFQWYNFAGFVCIKEEVSPSPGAHSRL